MTLPQLAEPLFHYICRLNRSARKGGGQELRQVRSEVKGLFADMRAKAAKDPRLSAQYERVELPLLFFVDFMIKERKLPFAADWQELAHERNELGGDERFFDLLDVTLADTGPESAERLEVFYTCLGLGFTGWYTGQPEQLRKKMLEISGRLRGRSGELEQSSRIVPEAYEHVNGANLIDSPGGSLMTIGIALVGL